MTVRQTFRRSPAVQETVDFLDFSTGHGIKRLYGAYSLTSGAATYYLTDKQPYSYAPTIISGTASGTAVLLHDLDFDIQINSSKVVDGTVVVNVAGFVNGVTNSTRGTFFFDIVLRRVSDGTETDITNTVTSTITGDGATYLNNRMFLVPLTVTDEKFSGGDTLRLTVKMWCYLSAGSGSTNFEVGVDPQNRDSESAKFDNEPTLLTVDIPFKPTF